VDQEELQARQASRRLERERRHRHRRLGAGGVLLVVVGAIVAVVVSSGGGSGTPAGAPPATSTAVAAVQPAHHHTKHHHTTPTATTPHSTVSPTARSTGHPGHAAIPILMYHVIADPLPTAPYPGLYVPVAEFKAQMKALKDAGWHAVTQDQALAHWRHGTSLGKGKPIVLSFDNGYHSQYASAMPILRKLGWAGVENIQLTGLPPSQGGLSRKEVRTLLADGWELDTQGISHADLVTLDATQLHHQIVDARRTLEHRYHVIVDWFCYPSGHYDATVVSAVRAAGFVGSTTVIPGWAHGTDDRYRLSRLRVLGGTTPQQLLAQIDDSKAAGPAPASYTSAG
jgi:peptidoglycan/xylan/chitin deacetylase (PgdA/CDA1 family)